MVGWIALGLLIVGGIALVVLGDSGSVAGMAPEQFGGLVAGLALLIWIGSGMFGSVGTNLVSFVRNAAIWLFIAFVLVAGYAYREDLAPIYNRVMSELDPSGPETIQTATGTQAVRVLRSVDGHFAVRASINGSNVPMLVDTGASTIVLSLNDAERVRIPSEGLSFVIPVQTANGTGFAARTRIASITVGSITERDIDVLVASQGALNQSLLGMNFLNRLTSYSVRGDELILQP